MGTVKGGLTVPAIAFWFCCLAAAASEQSASQRKPFQEENGFQLANNTTETIARAKRSLYFPGTNWCGVGHKGSEEELGIKEATDRCCRTHDHCSHKIKSFRRKYGLWNTMLYTMSHCSCDDRFFSCLKAADTDTSHRVGRIFFNILRTKCFTIHLKKNCAKLQSNRCVSFRYGLKAEKKNPKYFTKK